MFSLMSVSKHSKFCRQTLRKPFFREKCSRLVFTLLLLPSIISGSPFKCNWLIHLLMRISKHKIWWCSVSDSTQRWLPMLVSLPPATGHPWEGGLRPQVCIDPLQGQCQGSTTTDHPTLMEGQLMTQCWRSQSLMGGRQQERGLWGDKGRRHQQTW